MLIELPTAEPLRLACNDICSVRVPGSRSACPARSTSPSPSDPWTFISAAASVPYPDDGHRRFPAVWPHGRAMVPYRRIEFSPRLRFGSSSLCGLRIYVVTEDMRGSGSIGVSLDLAPFRHSLSIARVRARIGCLPDVDWAGSPASSGRGQTKPGPEDR